MKTVRPYTILVQSEFEEDRFYRVSLGQKARDDRCSCPGVNQYLGRSKTGRTIYRRKYNCFHVEWARKYAKAGEKVLFCQYGMTKIEYTI